MLRKMVQLISFGLMIFIIGISFSYGQVTYRDYRNYNPEVPRITAFEAMSLYKQGKLVLMDVAPPDRFRDAHIVGAMSLPKENIGKTNIVLPNNLIIAFYCG